MYFAVCFFFTMDLSSFFFHNKNQENMCLSQLFRDPFLYNLHKWVSVGAFGVFRHFHKKSPSAFASVCQNKEKRSSNQRPSMFVCATNQEGKGGKNEMLRTK